MSFLFGSTRQIADESPRPLGIDESRYTTNQAARPLPYVNGRTRFSLTWITDVLDVFSSPIVSKVGKKSRVTGYSYFATIAGVGAHGPFASIQEILFDGEKVWTGDLTATGDSDDIAIEGRGTARIYWGTATQTPDTDLESDQGEDHPAYVGQFYIIFFDLNLGQNRTQLPNIEVVASRYVSPDWFTASEGIGADVNIFACLAEWATSQVFGLGLAEEKIDTDQINTVAAEIVTDDLGVSPLVDRSQTFRQLATEALGYVDGYIRMTDTGKLAAFLVRPDSAPSVSFDEGDIVGEPQADFGSWNETFNFVTVEYEHRGRDYTDQPSNWTDSGNFQITGEPKFLQLSRPWVKEQDVADRIAAAAGRQAGIPAQTGTITVRESRLQGLQVGERFLWSWSDYGIEDLVCRALVFVRQSPDVPLVQIQFEVDRSELNDDVYLPPTITPPTTPTFDPVVNSDEILFEVPNGFDLDPAERLFAIAVRGNLITTGFNAFHRRPSTTYVFESEHDRFAVHGTLDEDYPVGTFTVDDELGLLVTIDSADEDFENVVLADALTNDVLLFVNGEILSIFGAVLQSGTTWRIYAIRARYDTEKESHSMNDEVFIVQRSEIPIAVSHPEDATQTWKLQPFSINRDVDISSVSTVTLDTDHRTLRPYRPLNLAHDGDKAHPEFSTGEDLELTWSNVHEDRTVPFWDYWEDGISEDLPETVLEFWTADGMTLQATVEIAAGVESYTYPNATLQSDFGGEESVLVRAYHRRDLRSTLYAEVLVTFN